MPARRKGPHLWLRRARRGNGAKRAAVWLIRDGDHRRSTGCLADDLDGAEEALRRYIAAKRISRAAAARNRDPAHIPVADVLSLYARDVAPRHAAPIETLRRIEKLSGFFGGLTLADINGARCRAYATARPQAMARRELEDLRAAIRHHRREGLCSEIIEVVLPERGPQRERWLTRGEAAAIIRAAWRHRERQAGAATARATRRHIARFVLVALYTGSRAGVILRAALQPAEGHGWFDLTRGVFYRRAAGRSETKKRAPPIPLPPRLLAHLRRWRRNGQRFAVEWNGAPVRSIRKAFAAAVDAAGLDSSEVTPHVLRHTAATWLMQAGVDLWPAGGYLGMTVEMLSRRYGHHHPDHLKQARDAFSRRREAVAEAVAGRR